MMRDIARSAVLFSGPVNRVSDHSFSSELTRLQFYDREPLVAKGGPSSGFVKPTLPPRSLRPLREAKFVAKLGSDEVDQNCFRRTNRRGPGSA